MKKFIPIIGLVLVIVIGFTFINTDEAAAPVDPDQAASTVAEENNDTASEFGNPFNADTGAIRENLRVTVNSSDFSSILDIGVGGDIKIETEADGEKIMFIRIGEDTYFQDPESNSWFTYSADLTSILAAFQRGIDADVYQAYETEGVEEKRTEACASGTCRVYTLTSEGQTGTLYVDTETNRIMQWAGTDEETGDPISFNYDYDADISIEAPANVQTIGL